MWQYYLGFTLAAILTELLSNFLIGYAHKKNIFLPEVRERDLHTTPIPRIGGIAIVVSFIMVVVAFYLFDSGSLTFVAQKFLGVDRNLFGLLLAIIILSVVNIADDYRSTPVWLRLATQALASVLVIYFGIELHWLTNPFGGKIMLEAIGPVFVVLWLVGLSNVTNWLDGMNGLADGVGLIALIVLFILSLKSGVNQPANALLAAIAAGALIGFLPFNLIKAKAFLGDTGSVFIGFLVGVLAIISGGKIATAFLVLSIPVLDALVVFVTRIVHRRSPFQADRTHLHHRLLDLGLKPWQVVTIFYAITILFGLIALNTRSLGKIGAVLCSVLLMIFLVALYSIKKPNEQKSILR